jgi:hypothetical protein
MGSSNGGGIVVNSNLAKTILQNKPESIDKPVSKKIKSIYDLSRVGFSGPGVKKTNQDCIIICKNLMNDSNCMFLSVW